MKCATVNCEHEATARVFWPGQTKDMCGPCATRASNVAYAMGFTLAVEPLADTLAGQVLEALKGARPD